jgi:hypothetical protein
MKKRAQKKNRISPLYQRVERERRTIEQAISRKQGVIISRPKAQQRAHPQA